MVGRATKDKMYRMYIKETTLIAIPALPSLNGPYSIGRPRNFVMRMNAIGKKYEI